MAIAIALLCLHLFAQATPEVVRPGDSVLTSLTAGVPRVFELVVESEGTLTISVEAVDFDPRLTARDARGRELAHDDDTGPGSGAWLSLEAGPHIVSELVVTATEERGGRFLLSVHEGRRAAPTESATHTLRRVLLTMIKKESAAGRPSEAYKLCHRLGELLFQRGEYSEAGPVFQAALALAEQQGNAWGAAVERAFLGAVERRVGSDDVALELLQDARAPIAARDIPALDCFVLENLGEALFDLGRHVDALQAFDDFVERAAAGGLDAFEPMGLARLARVHELQGDIARARSELERALAGLEAVQDPAVRAEVLLAAGQFHEHQGGSPRARELYEQALSHDAPWDVRLALEAHLGHVRMDEGDYGAARACLDRAGQILTGRVDGRFDVHLRMALAHLSARTGELHAALSLSEEALRMAEAAGDVALQARLLAEHGLFQEQVGDVLAASTAYERAHGLCAEIDVGDLEWVILFRRGRLERMQGRPAAAVRLQRSALEVATRRGDVRGRAAALSGLAYAEFVLGEHGRARLHAGEAMELVEAAGHVDLLVTGPLHTLTCVELAEGDLDAAAACVARAESLIERDDLLALEPFEAAGARSWFVEWGALSQDLITARLAEPDVDRVAVVAEGLRQAGSWKARALLEGLPATHHAAAGVESVRATLGAGRALVEFAEGRESLHAYVLDQQGLRRLSLAPLTELTPQLDRFLEGMVEQRTLSSAEEVARDGSALYALLLAPVLATLGGEVEGLVLVPTPELSRLPFEALVMGVERKADRALVFGDLRFVADAYHVTYGPSTPVLAGLVELGPRRREGRVLLLGDPLYARTSPGDGDATPRAPMSTTWPRLRGTRAEVVDIASFLLGTHVGGMPDELVSQRSGLLEAERFDLYLGQEASAARLQRDLREYAILHIAAHGRVDSQDPARSGLVLALEGGAPTHITLADILGLRLDADLVVLSACETATGRVLKGEGVQSMATAFLYAGSRAVVASLWSVDDAYTRRMMASFYESFLIEGRPRSEALRDAKSMRDLKRAIREQGARGSPPGGALKPRPSRDYGHPHYWAPFVYIGAIPPPG